MSPRARQAYEDSLRYMEEAERRSGRSWRNEQEVANNAVAERNNYRLQAQNETLKQENERLKKELEESKMKSTLTHSTRHEQPPPAYDAAVGGGSVVASTKRKEVAWTDAEQLKAYKDFGRVNDWDGPKHSSDGDY
jgi:hypothetical protein